jgi:hypothetical protein
MLLNLFHKFGNEACRHAKKIEMVLKCEKKKEENQRQNLDLVKGRKEMFKS